MSLVFFFSKNINIIIVFKHFNWKQPKPIFLCLATRTNRTASVSADSFKIVTLITTSFLETLRHEKTDNIRH